MNTLISVVIPVYNGQKYLERCVNSVIHQTYTDLQIILVDDGSTDNSGNICDIFAIRDKRVKVIHKDNGGSSSARNAGIKNANGDFIGFVDSDDWISSDMYSYLYNLIANNKADVAQIKYINTSYSNIMIKNTENYNVKCYNKHDAILAAYLNLGMSDNKSYSVCTKLYKRKLFNEILFPAGQKYEDVVTNYEILSIARKYVISDNICYFYFNTPESVTRHKFNRTDFDILTVGDLILEKSKYSRIIYPLGKMTYACTRFTCIGKMLRYGVNADDIDLRLISSLIKTLRINIWILLNSLMNIKLKFILCILCVSVTFDYYLIIFNITNRLRYKINKLHTIMYNII